MSCRVKIGGLETKATEADAKKNNYPVFKTAKHPALKATALLDIAAPAKADTNGSPTKAGRPATAKPSGLKGLKPPTRVGAKTDLGKSSAGLKRPTTAAASTEAPVNTEEDPIGSALQARNAAGGLSA